jgi:hypothetical protein
VHGEGRGAEGEDGRQPAVPSPLAARGSGRRAGNIPGPRGVEESSRSGPQIRLREAGLPGPTGEVQFSLEDHADPGFRRFIRRFIRKMKGARRVVSANPSFFLGCGGPLCSVGKQGAGV